VIIKYNHTIEQLLDRVRVIVYVGSEQRVTHDFPLDQRNLEGLIESITTEKIYDGLEMDVLHAERDGVQMLRGECDGREVHGQAGEFA
jgi:hypothetical protein